MNCNFYWQPACFQLMPEIPTNLYLDQNSLNLASQSSYQPSYQEFKNKCMELELQNIRLQQELKQLKENKLNKIKRIVKRRKQEQLVKKYRCLNQNCKKQYASSLALNLHMKTKHNPQSKEKNSQRKEEVSFEKNLIKQQGQQSNFVESKTLFQIQ